MLSIADEKFIYSLVNIIMICLNLYEHIACAKCRLEGLSHKYQCAVGKNCGPIALRKMPSRTHDPATQYNVSIIISRK